MTGIDIQRVREIDSIEDHEDRILAAAVMYAESGLYVVPLRPNAKVLPAKRMGVDYASATRHIPTVQSWFGEGGKFRGYNIGLACGATDGIYAVDVDTKQDDDGRTGFDTLAELESDNGSLDTAVQVTPSGGKHYVFAWDGIVGSSTSKLGHGIDTRGGDGRCRSHIVAWPSEVHGERYEWLIGGDIADGPEWVAESLGEPWKHQPKGTGRGNENVETEDLETQYTLKELWKMINNIDPNDLTYQEWLWIGQALHSQHDSSECCQMWDTWSKRGDRYEPNECFLRWDGFSSDGTVRIGTLIHIAKDHGYIPKPAVVNIEDQTKSVSEFDELIEAMNEEWGVAVVGGKVRIIGLKLNERPDTDFTVMGLDDFKNLMMNQKTIITDAKGNPKVVPKAQLWLADENRKTFEGGVAFRPDKAREFDSTYNLWSGWKVEPEKGDWSALKKHMKDIICRGNIDHFNWLMDWAADLLQDPANPKGCAIVMKGQEGAGKGTLVEALGKLMGRHYKHLTQEEHLTGRFNSHLMDGLLVFADEVVYGGSKKTAGTLKALVSERNLMVEKKGVDVISYRNCAHLAIASNEDWFIPAGPNSRRWFVLDVAGDKANNRKWFDAIHEQLDNGGYAAMMYELMNREVTSNLMFAPETNLLQLQRAQYQSNDTIIEWWARRLDKGEMNVNCMKSDDLDVSWPVMVDRAELFERYEEWCIARKCSLRDIASKTAFYGKMQELGLTMSRPSINGVRKRVLEVPSIEEALPLLKKVGGIDLDI